jgi:hypothetical protein
MAAGISLREDREAHPNMKSLKMTDNPMTHWKLTGSEPMRAI